MSDKLKWILYVSFLWGIPFWSIMSIYRWIDNRPITFSYLFVLFIMSILGGALVGFVTHIFNKNKKDPKLLVKPILIITSGLYVYLAILKLVLIPNELRNTWVNGLSFIVLVVVLMILQKKVSTKE